MAEIEEIEEYPDTEIDEEEKKPPKKRRKMLKAMDFRSKYPRVSGIVILGIDPGPKNMGVALTWYDYATHTLSVLKKGVICPYEDARIPVERELIAPHIWELLYPYTHYESMDESTREVTKKSMNLVIIENQSLQPFFSASNLIAFNLLGFLQGKGFDVHTVYPLAWRNSLKLPKGHDYNQRKKDSKNLIYELSGRQNRFDPTNKNFTDHEADALLFICSVFIVSRVN